MSSLENTDVQRPLKWSGPVPGQAQGQGLKDLRWCGGRDVVWEEQPEMGEESRGGKIVKQNQVHTVRGYSPVRVGTTVMGFDTEQ